jgi:hypothetical protein
MGQYLTMLFSHYYYYCYQLIYPRQICYPAQDDKSFVKLELKLGINGLRRVSV